MSAGSTANPMELTALQIRESSPGTRGSPADSPMADLTDKTYWEGRQCASGRGDALSVARPRWEWLPIVMRFISTRPGASFLELGCSPGDVSAAICSRVPLQAEGVDFADTAAQYLERMRRASVRRPVLHQCDIREFRPGKRFDIVASFGLVEHFTDFGRVLDIHDKLLAPGGLCVVEVPNFRGLQWLYHAACDTVDLRRHNTAVMETAVFRDFAARSNHQILFLDYCGRLRFWGVDQSGPAPFRMARRVCGRSLQRAAALAAGILPDHHPSLAPWILYIGQKSPMGPSEVRPE